MKHSDPRPAIVGSDDGPEPPFPLKLEGPVVKGFGRGSKELGIPTANLPIEGLSVAGHTDLASGVYFGYCSLQATSTVGVNTSTGELTTTATAETSESGMESLGERTGGLGVLGTEPEVYQMVMSIGWNPFYKNTVRSVEVHVLHKFPGDFYGAKLKLLILGYVRDELDYVSREALIEDIQTDINVTRDSLARGNWAKYKVEGWLRE